VRLFTGSIERSRAIDTEMTRTNPYESRSLDMFNSLGAKTYVEHDVERISFEMAFQLYFSWI